MVHLSHILFRKELNGLKILILSCDTGEGHNSAGKAIKEAAEHKGHSVTMIDMFLLSGKGTSHAVSGAYIGIVKHIPFFFGLLYKVGMLISSDKRKSLFILPMPCFVKSYQHTLNQTALMLSSHLICTLLRP